MSHPRGGVAAPGGDGSVRPAPQRVLVAFPSIGTSGPDRFFLSMARRLSDLGFEVCIFTRKENFAPPLPLPDSILVEFYGGAKGIAGRYPVRRMVDVLLRFKPDIVFTGSRMNVVAALARRMRGAQARNSRHIVRCQVNPAIYYKQLHSWRRWYIPLAVLLEKWSYRQASGVVVQSRSMAAAARGYFGYRCADRVVYNPVEAGQTGEDATGIGAIGGRKNGQYWTAVAVGRLTYQKGFDILIDAAHRLKGRLDNIRFVILGDGEDRAKLERQARLLGVEDRVQFEGHTRNVGRFLKQADLMVLPSRFEGVPNAVLEALMFGLPCVVTRCDSGNEEIIRDRFNGLLVPVEDPQAIADAVLHMTETFAQWDPVAIADDARLRFSPDNAVATLVEFFLHTAGEIPAVSGARPDA